MHANKPSYGEYCDYCGSNTITKLATKNTITIEDIDLNAPFGELQQEFFNYDGSQSDAKLTYNWWSQRTPYNNGVLQNGLYKRPFGYIIDHMSDFIKLNAAELDNLWLKLYGKSNVTYFTNKYVKVKLIHMTEYVLVKMYLTDIILWFKDSNITYKFTYSKLWKLQSIMENDETTDIINSIKEASKEYNQDISGFYYSEYYLIS